MNGAYVVRFADGTRKSFNTKLENAKKQAEAFRTEQSLLKNLTRNQHRIIECDTEGTYIEVDLGNHIMKIDQEDLKFIQTYSWCAKKP